MDGRLNAFPPARTGVNNHIMTNEDQSLASLGSRAAAEAVASRAESAVPAYAAFLQTAGFAAGPFTLRPILDKASYIAAFPLTQLVGDDFDTTFSIIASSGSSGTTHYWPQLRAGQQSAGGKMFQYLDSSFQVGRHRTMAIVGLALGSWIGGDSISWVLKNAAAQSRSPFAVFSPGSRHDEIIRVIAAAAPIVDRFLIFLCPSAIGHLHLLADQRGIDLPHEKIRYVVIGEPFPETLRARLTERVPPAECPILSMYGSADTGLLGVESPASAAARSSLASDAPAAAKLGIHGPVPHLFHIAADDAFLEDVAGELCVTRWQGVPLVRYNIHDSVRLLPWRAARAAALSSPLLTPAARTILDESGDVLPDLIAISGSADRCLILCGTNITESVLDEAVGRAARGCSITGLYRASITYGDGRQRLRLEVEARAAGHIDPDHLYTFLIRNLGDAQPEFRDDWQNVYHTWDGDPSLRILDLSLVPWPQLSQRDTATIKNRGVHP